MEEFYLRSLLAGDKLNVVNEEHLYAPKLLSKPVHTLESYGVDEFVGELFGGEVTDLGRVGNRPGLYYSMANGIEKMRLAQTDASVDEEWIVSPPRRVGYCLGWGRGKLISPPDPKIIKGIAGVEHAAGQIIIPSPFIRCGSFLEVGGVPLFYLQRYGVILSREFKEHALDGLYVVFSDPVTEEIIGHLEDDLLLIN